jgi:hypothetical protein
VLVRGLVRDAELSRHLAQAQFLDAVFGDHLPRGDDAGVAQFERRRGGCLLPGHGLSRVREG